MAIRIDCVHSAEAAKAWAEYQNYMHAYVCAALTGKTPGCKRFFLQVAQDALERHFDLVEQLMSQPFPRR